MQNFEQALQKTYMNGQKGHEKMPNTMSYEEIQIKTTMRFHCIPTRMAKTKKASHNKCGWGCGTTETLRRSSWECGMVQSFWKKSTKMYYKVKYNLIMQPGIPLLGITLEIWIHITTWRLAYELQTNFIQNLWKLEAI